MVIVSSRPATVKDIRINTVARKVEVEGFKDEQISRYIDSFFSTDSARLKEYLQLHPNVHNMCNLPLLIAMICFLYKMGKGSIPCTQTKIYEEFTRYIILRHLRSHNDKTQLHSLKDLSGDTRMYFNELCQLAYKITLENKQKIEFSQEGLNDETGLGLVTIDLIGYNKNYIFLHMTLRDFLTAYYISSLETKEQMEIINSWPLKVSLAVLFFYCGLIDFDSDGGLDKLNCILNGKHDALQLMRYAFESQQHHDCDEVVTRLDGVLNLHSYSLTSTIEQSESDSIWPSARPGCSQFVCSDLSVVDYIMCTTSQTVERICLPPGNVTVLLLEQIDHRHLHQLQGLIVKEALDTSGIQHLAGALKSCTSLKFAYLKFNSITPDGATYISDGLKNLTSLQSLTLLCTLTSQGIPVLLEGLHYLTNTEIRLAFEYLDIDHVLEVPKGLSGLYNLNVWFLELSECIITPHIARTLSRGLNNLIKLQTLNISRNSICSESVRIIATGIKRLTNLRSLNLSYNSIDPDGVARLANAFKYLINLRYLNLSYNNIGPEGAISLANSLACLTSLRELYLSNNGIDKSGAIALLKTSINCNSLKKVDVGLVSFNLDVNDISDLVIAVQHPTKYRVLRLGNEDIEVPPYPQRKCSSAVLGCLLIFFIFFIFLCLLGHAPSYSKVRYNSQSLRDL